MSHKYIPTVFLLYTLIGAGSAYLINFQRYQYPLSPDDKKYFTSGPTDQSCTIIKGDNDYQIQSIRVRSDPSIGNPPHALALFSGETCDDSTLALIARYYQLSDNFEQSISPFSTHTEITNRLPGNDTTYTTPDLYNLTRNIGYTDPLWGMVIDLNLEPGDVALKYTSLNGTVKEWRVAKGVIAVEEEPNPLEADSTSLSNAYYEPILSTSLPMMAQDEREIIQKYFQASAERSPATEKLLLTEDPELVSSEVAGRDGLVRDHERPEIGKLARARNHYDLTPLRNNPNMIELNPLVNLPGLSHLQDLEKQKAPAIEDYLNDRDWDLYLPEAKV
ncbi:hypothetical protein TWF281_011651 [Arthrobotrys megalospora]